MRRFSVIGAGNLGTYFIDSLVKKGYSLKHIYRKSRTRRYDFAITGDIRLLAEQSDFIIISTQESRIPEVVQLMASCQLNGKVVFHTSNSLTSDELVVLKEKGARVASFSPLQTFPAYNAKTSENAFKGIYFLTEGDEQAVNLVKQIAGNLDAHVIVVEKHEKIYFHIAAVASCNFLIAILELAESQLKKVGEYPLKILMPLIKQTLENVETRGVEASLTGPVKRKEMGIVEKHLEILKKNPREAALYNALSRFLLK